ncbi:MULTISPECIES: DUF2092 domain-containing protein [unclassified Luteimonas]
MKAGCRIIIALALAGGSCFAFAVEPRPRPALAEEATEALEDIGAELRGLDSYALAMDVSTRAAVGGGKYRDFSGTVHYSVKAPSHLVARIQGKGVDRQVFYDGQTITVYAPLQRVYARIEAPGTIRTLLEQVRARKGIELPVVDLFAWGVPDGPMSSVTRASYAGRGMVRGRECEHYAYAEAGVSWEVWADDDHLPCKVVMVDATDAGLPGYRAELSWDTAAQPADGDFVFAPGEGVTQVELSQISETDHPPGEGP